MLFGVTCDPKRAAAAKRAGYDYFEATVGGLLCPEKSDADFAAALAAHRAAELPCPALAIFLPGDLKVTGNAIDRDRQRRYLDAVFPRAQQAGVELIVFGSGGARNVPEGFDHATAVGQLRDFVREAGDRAAAHGVRLAMEPLCDSNILSTLAETIAFVDDVNHPAVRLLVDAYHWGRQNETADVIAEAGPRLIHAHIATVERRLAPGAEPCDFAPFVDGLRRAGYDGRLSMESFVDPDDEAACLAAGLAEMKRLFA